MRRQFIATALTVIILCGAEPMYREVAQEGYARELIRSLELTKAQRVSLKRGHEPNLAPCIDRLATDARLEADLVPVVARSVPTEGSARPILAF